MRSMCLAAAVAALPQALFLFADLAAAKPTPSREEKRDLRFYPNGVARYHYRRPPMRPVKIIIVDKTPSSSDKDDGSQVVVYVDPEGHPIETLTQAARVVPSPTPAPKESRVVEAASNPSLEAAKAASLILNVVEISAPPSPTPSQAEGIADETPKLKPASAAGPAGNDTLLSGVTYSPYNSDGTCKTGPQVAADIRAIAPLHSLIRIYGVDCNQVATLLAAVQPFASSLRLFLGIFNLVDLTSQITTLIKAVTDNNGGGWRLIDTISIGNELVNNNQATPQQILSSLATARTALRRAGYTGPVVTVDTVSAIAQNPSLCDASDYCAINVHPFFDPNTSPDKAGEFIASQVKIVREKLADPKQRIVVTETGWPWAGNANGLAVPGRENQKTAIGSIVARFGGDGEEEGMGSLENLILFTAFNDQWKKAEAGTFFAEQYWGMYN
ncbi:cell wall glucanase [Rhypophila decipiens]|uniref:Cell wall glucanase n=1 Tax=Rhypophila decipiens TaxID=261697 RepID=A0AAN6YIR7_9PEZI|nr:cell wall glucanase [Rhypophila decipiens]